VVILLYSNGKPVASMSGNLQPTVLIAYTSTLANAFMGAALVEAVVVSFWHRALEGTTVRDWAPFCSCLCHAEMRVTEMPELHHHWASGQSVLGAVKALCSWKTLTVSVGKATKFCLAPLLLHL